jgi:hypothetical protein
MRHRFLTTRASLPLIALLAALVVTGGCGGSSPEPTPTATRTRAAATASPAERSWRRQVQIFASSLLPALRSVQDLTGGSRTAGAFGERLDPRLFVPGPKRRAFLSALETFSRCAATLEAVVPAAPTGRLRPVRVALVHACRSLELVPPLIRQEVLAASSAAEVDPQARTAAATRTQEGVTLLVDALAILERVLGG